MRARRRTIAALALLMSPLVGPTAAGAFELFTNCQFVDERVVLIDVTPVATSRDGAAENLDLMIHDVYIEARSASGRFWIQLPQPKTANLEFDLCVALGEKQIRTRDLDAIRILVIGDVSDGDETVEITSRCGLFPPPSCQKPE